MTITYKDNSMHIECDDCNRKPEFYFGEWKEAWARAKADGWQSFKDSLGAWIHRCPACTAEETP